MTISAATILTPFVSSANTLNNSPGTLSATIPLGAVAVVHAGTSGSAAGTFSISDTQSQTWTPVTTPEAGTGSPATTTAVWVSNPLTHALNAGTDTISVSHSANTGSLAVSYQYYTFTGISLAVDQFAVEDKTTTSATVTCPTITVTAGALLLVFVDTSNVVTTLSAFSTGGALDYLNTTTGTSLRTSYGVHYTGLSGSVAPTWTQNSAQEFSAIAVTLLETSPTGGWAVNAGMPW